MNREMQQVANTSLLKEGIIEERTEIEAMVMEYMKKQVGKGIEQSLKGEVNEKVFFDEESRQNI